MFGKVNIVVCSSELKPEQLLPLSKNKPLVIVTTDWFYPNERKRFQEIFKTVSFYCFNDFISDAELEAIDNLIIKELKPWVGHEYYYGAYTEGQKFHKSRVLVESLKRRYSSLTLLYLHKTLGISPSFFKGILAIEIDEFQLPFSERHLLFKHRIKYWLLSKIRRQSESESYWKPQQVSGNEIWPEVYSAKVDLFEFNGNHFLILGGLRRLKNKSGNLLFSGEINLVKWREALSGIIGESILDNCINLGVEAHNFKWEYTLYFQTVTVLADGYWPPNYSYCYHDIYPEEWEMGCLAENDELFCAKNYLKFNTIFNFLKSTVATPESQIDKPKDLKSPATFVLLAQCTSEWSALINRSDTAKLIEAYFNLALKFPQSKFVIRPHPGMTLNSHDGAKSIERIKAFIKELGISNILISEKLLQQDIELGDIFITEFSTTVFETMALGKIWISLNTTNRRNFMEYFTNMGFLHAKSESELFSLVHLILSGNETINKKFIAANNQYNQKLLNH
jgi:hypothetical protein